MKEIHKELSLDDNGDGDLIHTDDDEDEACENAYSIIAYWNWKRRNYLCTAVEEWKQINE